MNEMKDRAAALLNINVVSTALDSLLLHSVTLRQNSSRIAQTFVIHVAHTNLRIYPSVVDTDPNGLGYIKS